MEKTLVKENKTTLNTVNTYLLGMGIRSDLIDDSLLLRGMQKLKREELDARAERRKSDNQGYSNTDREREQRAREEQRNRLR